MLDCGTYTEESTDYPDYAAKVCQAINTGEAERGILVCGTGIGISIAANKIHPAARYLLSFLPVPRQ